MVDETVNTSDLPKFVDTASADLALPEMPDAPAAVLDVPYVLPEMPPVTPADPILAEDLQTLHGLISAIAPITGLAFIDGEPAELDYLDLATVTPAQQTQIAAVLATWPQLREKNAQLRQINADWQATVAAGWETPYGWRLGLTTQDVTLLTGAFILAKEAAAMGLTEPAVIVDSVGAAHELSVPDLTALMLQYGQARAALSAEYAARKAALG